MNDEKQQDAGVPEGPPEKSAVIAFTLNGTAVTVHATPDRRVIDLLREDLGLTGSKEGCGTGECGACTIMVDGRTRLACLMVAAQLEGRTVETVESLADSDTGRRVRDAFVTHGAVQCGYCTPGMAMAALAVVRESPEADRPAIREALSGNLCRCTGYVQIIDAVVHVASEER
ncbi:(2Fe-2S)-binding protein [Desulfatitalea alkaliphila]|uniref:(2Fe-2S)-binding protein n=1 Tax=Desulfatitalea alkaliphila TaxID=2929485 RepID=A0AA41R1Q5_9BACT|nr:(2Fe-2S)-binding protein [Desulfatitalea alkaliphila]MCJ8499181.1 (2Fe-2S)-binding protein [Desulfatitalea alkaliphila]